MTPDELRAGFSAAYPGANWDKDCAGAAYLACRLSGTVHRAYPSATAARLASVIVSGESRDAPPGAFHFWSYLASIGGVYQDWGHVATEMYGGGRAMMTNPERDEWDWGICLGITDVASWTARRQGIVTYLGWSLTYGENTANITPAATAGSGARPFETPLPEGGNMFIIHNASNPDQKVLVTVDAGQIRARYLEDPYERAVFLGAVPALPVTACDDPTFEGFLKRVGYQYGAPIPGLDVNATVKVDAAAIAKQLVAAGVGRDVVNALTEQLGKK
ncbi:MULTISPECIES: hypothetical protein [unclassified Microbacterium]|uniref:hypothetical protein n=1 Tax=unclassified Microbacterium TaxID=2609290 RepID=UPI0030187861